jgi:pantoate--beta-alanine ligase
VGVEVISSVAAVRERLSGVRARGGRVGLVPTMGALHAGHVALIREAAAHSDEVVVSVFVNPAQFTQTSDLAAYPRTLESDVAAAASAGATIVFAPTADEVYPAGFSTAVRISGITDRWEGDTRGASHFDGVALVVTKLFGMVGADAAWFGRKDAQQVAVVRRLVADLNLPTEIRTVDTVRDADGLALSSRNVRLDADDRARAVALHDSLQAAVAQIEAGERSAEVVVASAKAVLRARGIEPEYFAVVDPLTFDEVDPIEGEALAIVAAVVGGVRLLDNLPLNVSVG